MTTKRACSNRAPVCPASPPSLAAASQSRSQHQSLRPQTTPLRVFEKTRVNTKSQGEMTQNKTRVVRACGRITEAMNWSTHISTSWSVFLSPRLPEISQGDFADDVYFRGSSRGRLARLRSVDANFCAHAEEGAFGYSCSVAQVNERLEYAARRSTPTAMG